MDMTVFHQIPQLDESIIIIPVAIKDNGDACGIIPLQSCNVFDYYVRHPAGINGNSEDDEIRFPKYERLLSSLGQREIYYLPGY